MMRYAVLLACAVLVSASAVAAGPVFFVAPDGNDAWSGTLNSANAEGTDGPFASLARAQKAVRAAGPANGARVYVRGGTYYVSEPIQFTAEDSGTAEHPVVWLAYKDETPRFVGGARLTGFQQRENGVWTCDLAAQGLDGKSFRQLFFDGQRLELARWPNKGDGELPGGGFTFVAGTVPDDNTRSFQYFGERPERWAAPENAEVSIWPNYNWWQTIAGIAELDAANRTIRLEEELPYTIEPGRRFFFRNVKEELDAEGEWFLDTDANTLHVQLGKNPGEGALVAPLSPHVLKFEGVRHFTLLGFAIEAAQSHALTLKDCAHCIVAKCTVRNAGDFGIRVEGGKAVRVVGNDICHTGRGGIVLAGGDRKTLTPARHEALNNHIHHFAELYKTYQTGVNISGVGNRIGHNLIHDAPHIAILLGGNDHVIEFNEIHHVCMEGSDNGAFYMGRDWTQRGNIIRHNVFHDIYGFGLAGLGPDKEGVFNYETPHQAWGVYLDDCSSGTTVFGNLFYRVPLCGVMIGGGRDNVVENNVFVECVPAFHIDDRWDAFCWDVMQERLEAMNYQEPPYSERYPALLEMGDDPRRPENNHFVRNVVAYSHDDFRGLSTTAPNPESAVAYHFDQFDPGSTVINNNLLFHHGKPVRVAWSVYKKEGRETLGWEQWRERGFDQDSIVGVPEFYAPENDDYRLRMGSPALRNLDLQPLQTHRAGLYFDEFRASWPPPKDERQPAVEHQSFPVRLEPAAPAPETPAE